MQETFQQRIFEVCRVLLSLHKQPADSCLDRMFLEEKMKQFRVVLYILMQRKGSHICFSFYSLFIQSEKN